jgi:hypothetical protein
MTGRFRCALAVLLLGLLAGCAPRDQVPGKINVAAYYVPAERLEAFSAGKAGDAFSPAWTTPNFVVEPSNNPYRLLVDFEGELSADPAAADNVFEVVWLINQEEQTGGPMQMLRFDRNNLTITGTQVKGRAITPPLSFRKGGPAALSLRLERHVGLKPTAITLSVRAGLESANWLETLLSLRVLMVGVVFLALAWWFRR